MNGNTVFGVIAQSVYGTCFGLSILGLIASVITSWCKERRLGRRVELWSDDAARMKELREAGASPAVAEQIVEGNKIIAIKECRIETGLGVMEAKELVERYENALYRYEPGTHTRRTEG